MTWLTEPVPVSNHDPAVPVAGTLLQSLPRGAQFHFLTFLPPPESDEALAVSCWLPRGKHTGIAHSAPTPPHQLSGGSQVFLMPRLLPESLLDQGHTIQLALPCFLLALCEIPVSASHAGKKASAFIEVHCKKQAHKTHLIVYRRTVLEGCLLH